MSKLARIALVIVVLISAGCSSMGMSGSAATSNHTTSDSFFPGSE
ncbi:hypothetical protein [Polaromonas jejuensis]|uniref:Lipoprotein n=1 Tax=Polaromonas jejuensis TaxID=457502 RepID=A0ABW0QEX6_9BURK|nr:hypothetical protein [Polaromonas jejuensis]